MSRTRRGMSSYLPAPAADLVVRRRRRPLVAADVARVRRRPVLSALTARSTLRWMLRSVRSVPDAAEPPPPVALASWRLRLRFSLMSCSTLSRRLSIRSAPRRRRRRVVVAAAAPAARGRRRRRGVAAASLLGLSIGTSVIVWSSPRDEHEYFWTAYRILLRSGISQVLRRRRDESPGSCDGRHDLVKATQKRRSWTGRWPDESVTIYHLTSAIREDRPCFSRRRSRSWSCSRQFSRSRSRHQMTGPRAVDA